MKLEERIIELEIRFHTLLEAMYDSATELSDTGKQTKNEFLEISALPLWNTIKKYQDLSKQQNQDDKK